jgi:hypothetical protein
LQNNDDVWLKAVYDKKLLKLSSTYQEELRIMEICDDKKLSAMESGKIYPVVPCKIVRIPTPLSIYWGALTYGKRSSYKRLFNRM